VEAKPHPDLSDALNRAAREQSDLQAAQLEAAEYQGQAASAGAWLWRTGVEIEQRVRDGIEKTEPDLATVLSVSQALKSPPSVPAAAAKSGGDGAGHSGPATPKSGERIADRPAGVDDLTRLVDAGLKARFDLERRLRTLRSSLANSRSESCKRVVPLGFQTPAAPAPASTGAGGAPAVTDKPVAGAAGGMPVRALPPT